MVEFLEIDHTNNNGNTHRKEVGRHLYKWIIKNNYPRDLQILCANCNRSKGKFGYCPHHTTQEDDVPIPTTKNGINRRARKAKALMHYGGKCICCSETHYEFLEFDHINNDGSHKREIGEGMEYIVRTLPKNIQLLCSNCNKAKGLYGKCPHMNIDKAGNNPALSSGF